MRISFTAFLLLLLPAIHLLAQKHGLDTDLIHKIDSLYKADQDCLLISPADSAEAKYQRVIRTNFPLVKAILDNQGFPGYDVVGREGSDQFFLLVQHSDFDVEFQKRALTLMKKQIRRKNANGSSYAYLVDRIEINSGRLQVYGTQVQMGESGTSLKPCKDVENLDKRRKRVGLEPIDDYLQKCDEAFKEMNPGLFKKDEQ